MLPLLSILKKVVFFSLALPCLFLIHAVTPSTLHAGGITVYEISTAEMRLGTAGWASRAEDPSTAFTNPAGMTRLGCPAAQVGGEAIYIHAVFDPNDHTTVIGERGNADIWLPAGSSFYVQPITDKFALGCSALGYFGSDLNFNHDWVGRYYFTKTFLEGFSLVPAAAYQVTSDLSIGVGANIMYGIFDQHSAVNNVIDHLPDGKMLLRHRYIAAGAVVGVLYEFNPCTRVGIQYMSPVDLKFTMVPKFKGIGPILTEDLTRTGLLKSKLKIYAKVPQSLILSAYHDFNECWSFMADAGWQQWSRFQKASVALDNENATTLTFTPKYQDTWHVAAGAQFRLNEAWILSGGIAYDSSAVSNKNRPLDFPVGQEWRFGTGARWEYAENIKFDFCYEFLWTGDLSINSNKGILVGNVDGKFSNLYSHFLSADLVWVF